MRDLRPPTQATLQDMAKIPWFSRVGCRHPEVSTARVVGNWYEAVTLLEGEWEELCLDAANGYCEQLMKVAKPRFQTWNETVELIKRETEPMIDALVARRADLQALPKVVHDTIRWDMLHLCIEAEYSDCLPPGFYASNSYWYSVGHLPCGWEGGRFPDGRIIIY